MEPQATAAPGAPAADSANPTIVARASHHWRDYRAKRLLMTVMLIAGGLWFGYDGFVAWPRQNARIEQLGKDLETARRANDEPTVRRLDAERSGLKLYTPLDIMIQKLLCFSLPVLGIAIFAWSFHQSRGAYRLADNVLTVPGHPPVPLDAITAIDKTDWDRKGIAYLNYELPSSPPAKGRLCLDDFVYERDPTDAIFKHVQRVTGTEEAKADATHPT
jgi:hypothetical protein